MKPNTIADLPDTDLLERIAAREQPALSELYDRHGRPLYSIIAAVLRDTDDAEEILQEVFVQIWKNAGNYRTELGTPRTWMLRMAHTAAIERLRARRLLRNEPEIFTQSLSLPDSVSGSEAADTARSGEESNAHLVRALSTLPVDERAVIDMAFLQGYSHDEIARITGVTLGTVRNRIRTGMVSLRSHLGVSSTTVAGGQ